MKIKLNLNCQDYGVYAATCNIRKQIYKDQIINSFTRRWNT